jgi:hypothetical protein
MGYYTNDKSTKTSSLANPTSLNLQPRPFAPLASDEKEEAVARKSGYSENFLEKIINTPRSESATPVQRKSGNRLKAIAAERNNAALQNQPIQRQESVEEKNEGKQEVAKEFIMNPEPPPVQRKLENHLRAKNAQRMAIQAKLAIGEPNDKYEQEADATAARVVQQINSPITSQSQPVQRKFENHLRAKNAQKMALQPKLAIGEPNDKYEQEADATASKVVQQINSPMQDQSVQKQESIEEEEELQMKPISSIQREAMEEEEELQMKPISSIQREAMEEEEELQMKPLVQRRENLGGGEASTDLESSIQSARGSGQSLDANLQRSMGQAMGADFSGVKVHTDSQSDQLNKSIQAKAFTTGQDVFFRQGAYEPSSQGGQELIAHELTHVVQQNGGAVQRSLWDYLPSFGFGSKKTTEDKPEDKPVDKPAKTDVQHGDARVFANKGATESKKDDSEAQVWELNWRSGLASPAEHPYYEKFKSRIELINKAHPAQNNAISHDLGLEVWTQALTTITETQGSLPMTDDGKWVSYENAAFDPLMNRLDAVVYELSSFASAQFTKASSFGFWSSNEGKEMSEEKTELTLESSGIGALFDGFGSLIGKGGFDNLLWGALSRGYAEMVAKEMANGGKIVEVYAGGQVKASVGNIWKAIESKALESGIKGMGKCMEDYVTYFSVARKTQDDYSGKGDKTVNEPGLDPGVWAKGTDREAVLAEGNRRFALLPKS